MQNDTVAIAEEFLGILHWQTRYHDRLLHARPGAGQRELIFAPHDADPGGLADIVLFPEDQVDPPCGQWATYADCLARAFSPRGAGALCVRVGRDLLLPDLLRRTVSALGQPDSEGTVLADTPIWQADPGRNGLHPCKLGDISRAAQRGECALLAVPAGDGLHACAQTLFDLHARALANASAEGALRLPLLIGSAEIRALGLNSAVAKAARIRTRTALTDKLVSQLASLGFLHVYIDEVERLREGNVLDPNSAYMADVIALGSFTLVCDREQVFHGPLFDDAANGPGGQGPPDPLRTIGDRFYWDRSLQLYDAGRGNPDRRAAMLTAVRQQCEELCADIAQRSEGRLSQAEVKDLLRNLALEQEATAAGSVPLTTITGQLRARMLGDRLRPANLRRALAALMGSRTLMALAPEVHCFRSTSLAQWLVADAIAEALAAFVDHDDSRPVEHILNRPPVPFWMMRLALAMDQRDMAGKLAAPRGLRVLLQELRFGEASTPPSAGLLVGNLWTLLLAVACDGSVNGRTGPALVRTIGGERVTFTAVSLSQGCFASVDISSWHFVDCDLGHALFMQCNLAGTFFTESSLTGARFEDCRFRETTSFAGADVSGALFLRPVDMHRFLKGPAIGRKIARSNWSAAAVQGVPDQEGDAGILQPFRTGTVSAAALRYGDGDEISWPAAALAAFLRGWWDERPVLNRRNGQLYRLAEFTARFPLADAERHLIAVKQIGRTADAQRFVGLDNRQDCWIGRFDGAVLAWTRVAHVPGSTDLSIAAGDAEGDLGVLAAVLSPALQQISIGQLDDTGGTLLPLDTGFAVRATRWYQPARPDNPRAELAIAGASGGARIACWDGQRWRLSEPIPALDGIVIETFGYSPRENVLVACGAGGEIVGLRHIEPGVFQPMYRFNTALRQIHDVVMLNPQGQLLVVGNTRTEGAGPAARRALLWVLVGASGGVVAVVPQPPGTLFPDISGASVPLPDDAVEADYSEDWNRASVIRDTREAIKATLDQLTPERETLPIAPRISSTLEVILNSAGPHRSDEGGSLLPESFEDIFGPRFRTVELVIEDAERAGRPRQYIESELEYVSFEGGRVKARITPRFKTGVKSALATLTLGYTSSQGEAPLRYSHKFDLQLEWEDNPFTSDGTPVTGKQFFGMEETVERMRNALIGGEHVIVMSRRRAGKSSLVLNVANALRAAPYNRAAITISGENVVSDMRIDRAVQESLRLAGAMGAGRRFSELGGMRLSATDTIVGPLSELAAAAFESGFAPPFVLFVDEWGYLYNKEVGKLLVNSADKLKACDVVLCLTSVPGDFPVAAESYLSGDYRFFGSHTLEIGPMSPSAMQDLISKPLADRGFAIAPDALDRVQHLASGVPHDANIVMHSAFKAAKAEVDQAGTGKGRRIEVRHVMGTGVSKDASPLHFLREKYAAQREMLLGRLDAQDRARIFGIAADILQDYDNQAPSPREFVIPPIEIPGERGLTQFSKAGYRVISASGSHDEAIARARLWLPWGLASYLATIGQQ